MSFPHLSLPIHYKLSPLGNLHLHVHIYIEGFIELWQPYKAGLDKHTLIHTSKTLQVNRIKQHSRRNLVWPCMFCVNVVHSQIVTGWEIILRISFTQNAVLNFNIKIQMPYFRNTCKYCGILASIKKYGIWISHLCSIKLSTSGGSVPQTLWPGALPWTPLGAQPPDPKHSPLNVCYSPPKKKRGSGLKPGHLEFRDAEKTQLLWIIVVIADMRFQWLLK